MFHNKFPKNTYFLGCPHINHKNICRGVSNWSSKDGTRDFSSLEEMNQSIINSINTNVGPDDFLWLIGDILFGPKDKFLDFYNQIHCQQVYLIFGNHDDWIRRSENKDYLDYFNWYGDYNEILIDNQLIVLCHYPIYEWRDCHKNSWMICSHSHGKCGYSNKDAEYKIMDVGWENYKKPLAFSEIKSIMNKRKTKGHN